MTPPSIGVGGAIAVATPQARATVIAHSAPSRRDVVSWLALAGAAPARALDAGSLRAQLAEARKPTTSTSTTTRVPMTLEGGTYVADFTVGAAACRAVVDTGSPFVTTRRAASTSAVDDDVGAYWGAVSPSDVSFSAFEDTYETYGLQIDGITGWFAANDVAVGDFVFRELVIGVTDDVRNRGGSARGVAPFLGLVKQRQRWIRPTFLEQTDVVSFELDFVKECLTLSRAAMIDERERGTLRMVDLRPYGAPVFHYAALCDSLWINGEPYASSKPIYCVFDSGTTGVLVSRQLFDDSDFNLGAFETHMWFTDTTGEDLVVGSSLRACRKSCLFIVSPIDVPWPGVENGDFHVIFVGLSALMNLRSMTVDADRGLVRLGPGGAGNASRKYR